jgi:hypothetical protein
MVLLPGMAQYSGLASEGSEPLQTVSDPRWCCYQEWHSTVVWPLRVPGPCKLCQILDMLPPGMAQYSGLTSEGQLNKILNPCFAKYLRSGTINVEIHF